MERESLYVDNLIQAMAARASGGLVLAQVERVATENSLRPRDVRIPGTLVDGVVIASPENHWMSYVTEYNPGFTAEIKTPVSLGSMGMDERKIIARRGLLEVVPDQVVNLGIGMAEGVALVAEEEKILSFFTLTTEPGVHGGVGASGHDFGPAKNYDAMLDMNQQFDFYNGGGLDVCFLGMAQVTAAHGAGHGRARRRSRPRMAQVTAAHGTGHGRAWHRSRPRTVQVTAAHGAGHGRAWHRSRPRYPAHGAGHSRARHRSRPRTAQVTTAHVTGHGRAWRRSRPRTAQVTAAHGPGHGRARRRSRPRTAQV
jgi:hypothetical protein